MKIILATPLYPPEIGGPATYTKELAELLKSDHEITIVAFASTSEKVPGTKLVTVSKRRLLPIRLIKFTWALWREARQADVIYVQNAVAAGLPALIAGKLSHTPIVLKFVGDEAWERATQLRQTTKELEDFLAHPEGSLKIRLIMKLQGFVLRNVDCVTTPSSYLRDAIVRTYGLNHQKTIVNYNAAQKSEEVPFEARVAPHHIVATARLVEWKGVGGIIRATALLTKEFPDVKLLIAGDGPEEENLKKLTKELDLGKHVTFLGRISRAETWHIRKSSEVYVLNSTYEGLPHTALTSFAAKIPIVATDIPGTNEAVYNGISGLLVPPGDDAALAGAIGRLFKDKTLREHLVMGAEKLLKEKFSWEAHITTLISILESVCLHPED